jgi:hypothetical protein
MAWFEVRPWFWDQYDHWLAVVWEPCNGPAISGGESSKRSLLGVVGKVCDTPRFGIYPRQAGNLPHGVSTNQNRSKLFR